MARGKGKQGMLLHAKIRSVVRNTLLMLAKFCPQPSHADKQGCQNFPIRLRFLFTWFERRSILNKTLGCSAIRNHVPNKHPPSASYTEVAHCLKR